MNAAAVSDALKGMTKRQMQDLAAAIERELRTCVLCGTEGATRFHAVGTSGPQHGAKASLLICPPCFERNRLPEATS